MTIKQTGGIFGRNPSFNDVDVDNDLTVAGDAVISGSSTVSGNSQIGSTSPSFTVGGGLSISNASRANIKLIDTTTDVNSSLMVTDNGASSNTLLHVDEGSNGAGTHYLGVYVSDSQIMRIKADGSVDMSYGGGNLIVASGKGIDFSATSGTGTSELFDDYEEGTYTATLTPSTSGSITLGASDQTLFYTKVGRVVNIVGGLAVSSVSLPVGNVTLNLPFAVVSGGSAAASIIVRLGATANISDYIMRAGGGASTAVIYLGDNREWQSDSAQEFIPFTNVYISLTYVAA